MGEEPEQPPLALSVKGAGPLPGVTVMAQTGADWAWAACDSQTPRHPMRSARDTRLIAPRIRKLAMAVWGMIL